MSTFIKPSSGSSTKKSDNVIEFVSHAMDNIMSPFDGVVSKVSTSTCGGQITISHDVKGKKYNSVLCNVPNILVASGQKVSSGQEVGRFGTNPILYSLNDGSSNVNTNKFFDVDFSEKEEKEKEKEKETGTNKQDPKRKKYGSFELEPGLSVPHQMFADLLATPLRTVKKVLNMGYSSEKTPLKEEIDRIKNLMK
jgi:hypothetical protein